MKRISIYKKVSLILAITTLALSFMTVPILGKVDTIYADSSSDTPADIEPVQPDADPNSEVQVTPDPVLNTENPEPAAEPEMQPTESVEEDSLGAMSLSAMSISAIGDDPNVQNELPDFGTNYNNGDCVTNTACETAEPVTNPNEYSDQGSYGEKDYVLPDISGNTANVVALKDGNDWYFFKKGSGETCVGTSFCVNFDDQGNVSVYSYQTQANGYKGYNMIHFWYVSDDTNEEVLGCTDRLALNFNPAATTDNGSCQYDEEVYGCTDSQAVNFDPNATADDQSCQYEEQILGCTDPLALNYSAAATLDDQSCEFGGGNPGGGGGTTTVTTQTGLIPVTAPSGGPTQELLLIPVTGMDLAARAEGERKLLYSFSALFFGISLVLTGMERKSKR